MAYIHPGNTLDLIAPRAVTVGDGALVGSLFGVSLGTYASGAAGEFSTEGVHEIAKTSAQVWAAGARIYWDNTAFEATTDSAAGQLIGVASEAAVNPSSTGRVKLLGNAPATAEGPQAAIASLTDNGGGTADGTVASAAAPVTLTDNTSFSGTHDDTLAAVTVQADLTGGESPTEAEFNTLLATTRVMAQNQSDIAQKVIELVTGAGVAQNNLKELTVKLESILVALRAAGIIAT